MTTNRQFIVSLNGTPITVNESDFQYMEQTNTTMEQMLTKKWQELVQQQEDYRDNGRGEAVNDYGYYEIPAKAKEPAPSFATTEHLAKLVEYWKAAYDAASNRAAKLMSETAGYAELKTKYENVEQHVKYWKSQADRYAVTSNKWREEARKYQDQFLSTKSLRDQNERLTKQVEELNKLQLQNQLLINVFKKFRSGEKTTSTSTVLNPRPSWFRPSSTGYDPYSS